MDKHFTREEILSGLPARRAQTLLFLIESRTAYLIARSRQAIERFLSEEAVKERNLAFVEAFCLGRQPPLRPTIQDLERCATQWGALVPETPRIRAALAHSLSRKYTFTRSDIPNIRAVLGLDQPAVQEAYQRLYGQPLETIFAPQVGPLDRLRWAGARLSSRLESLPPFWTAFALTLTETVGAGILALPIAIAGLGPLPGAVLLILFGLVNILTVAYMAEAVSRSGTIRYGSAYIGRVVQDYLGSAGAIVLSLGVFLLNVLALWAYYVGFSTTLANITPIPAVLWVGALLLVGLYFLRRGSLDATVASALLIGAVNIGLILMLSILALLHVRVDYLSTVNFPFVAGRPFSPTLLGAVFGVILSAYFGHLSVSNCARVVSQRDPSGRSLLWGCVAAQAVAMLIYVTWVVAVNGAVDPQTLAAESGTALIPLASRTGPAVPILGAAFTILCLGMASIHPSLGLFNLVREWLPRRSNPTLTLPVRQGRVILSSRRWQKPRLHVEITYLGMRNDEPRLRLDIQAGEQQRRIDLAPGEHWDAAQQPDLAGRGLSLTLDVLQANQRNICLRIDSPLSVSYAGQWATTGLCLADLLDDEQSALMSWLLRKRQVNLADIAAYLEQDEESTRDLVDWMIDEGTLIETHQDGEVSYRVLLGSRRARTVAPGLACDAPAPPSPAAAARRVSGRGLGAGLRSLLSLSPVLAVFLLAEWSLLANSNSFSGLLGFTGVITVSMLAGIFPVLLLISSRRKGDVVPPVVYRILGNPLLLGGIYALSLSSLFMHGLFIWEHPVQRAGALLVGLAVVGVTAAIWRSGGFAPRLVLELRQEAADYDRARFAVVAAGQPVEAGLRLEYPAGEQRCQSAAGEIAAFSSLRRAVFDLPTGRSKQIKIWAHQVTAEGDSSDLPALVDVTVDRKTQQFDLKSQEGPIVLPLVGETCQVGFTLAEPG